MSRLAACGIDLRGLGTVSVMSPTSDPGQYWDVTRVWLAPGLGRGAGADDVAEAMGYRIMADTTIRLKHIGSIAYSWEDAGGERQRHANFTFHVAD